MSGGCGVNHATNCFRDIILTHYSPHAFAQQLGAFLKVDLSKASQLPKKELDNLCGVFAVFPEEQRKQFSLCSAKLKAAIESAPKLCGKKLSSTKKTGSGSSSAGHLCNIAKMQVCLYSAIGILCMYGCQK